MLKKEMLENKNKNKSDIEIKEKINKYNRILFCLSIIFLLFLSIILPFILIGLDKIGFFETVAKMIENIKNFFQLPIFVDYSCYWTLGICLAVLFAPIVCITFELTHENFINKVKENENEKKGINRSTKSNDKRN